MLNFEDHPFGILKVSVLDGKQAICEAFEDALLNNPASESKLKEARQSILISRRRLEWELRWFPGTRHETVRNAVVSITDNGDMSYKKLNGLARANYVAYRRQDYKNAHRLLADTFDDINETGVAEAINQDRSISGFGRVHEEAFSEAWQSLRNDLLLSALDAIVSTEKPADTMTQLLSLSASHETRGKRFVRDVSFKFEEWSRPVLTQIEARIKTHIGSQGNFALTKHRISAIVEELQEWNRYRKPVKALSSEFGAQDERAGALFDQIIEAINATEFGVAETEAFAVELVPVLIQVFSDLPSASSVLADMQKQANLYRLDRAFEEFEDLIEKVEKNPSSFISSIKKGQFKPMGRELGGLIFSLFQQLNNSANDVVVNNCWVLLFNLINSLGARGESPSDLLAMLAELERIGTPNDTLKENLYRVKSNLRHFGYMKDIVSAQQNQQFEKVERIAKQAMRDNPSKEFLHIYKAVCENSAGALMRSQDPNDAGCLGAAIIIAIVFLLMFLIAG